YTCTTNHYTLNSTSFSFYCSCHLPDLHSFPTRRSSDLCFTSHYSYQRDDQRLDVAEPAVLQVEDQQHIQRSDAHADKQRNVKQRSEEHTSELQSRENLVCRLLLEKKKL